MEKRSFTAEFKREAVKLATQVGVSKAKVAQELGLHANVLTRWVREARAGKWEVSPGKPLKTEQQQEIVNVARNFLRMVEVNFPTLYSR